MSAPEQLPVSEPSDSRELDVARLRKDFPILARRNEGHPLVYLDNAATTQKPRSVIAALDDFYGRFNSNVHRGVHRLSQEATDAFERARQRVQRFVNAESDTEIVFVRSTTEAINLVAHSFGRRFIEAGDEILITHMEHHSNIVPWQLLCEQTGAVLKVVPIDDRGELVMEEMASLLSPRTKLVSVVHISNALGTVNPVEPIVAMAHEAGARVLLDGAQAMAHTPIDVVALDCDFYAFSGHKMLGPTGVGVLYGKASLLEALPPYQGGGDMIRSVSFEKTLFDAPPFRFEAGTPNIGGAIGLAAAIDYLDGVGLARIAAYEDRLLSYATERVTELPFIQLIGTAAHKAAVLSFVVRGVHPHDVGTILDNEGVAIRTGHHCAQPVMERYGVPATARASMAFYNTFEEVDALVSALNTVGEVFGL